jgi:hypothetical protein
MTTSAAALNHDNGVHSVRTFPIATAILALSATAATAGCPPAAQIAPLVCEYGNSQIVAADDNCFRVRFPDSGSTYALAYLTPSAAPATAADLNRIVAQLGKLNTITDNVPIAIVSTGLPVAACNGADGTNWGEIIAVYPDPYYGNPFYP